MLGLVGCGVKPGECYRSEPMPHITVMVKEILTYPNITRIAFTYANNHVGFLEESMNLADFENEFYPTQCNEHELNVIKTRITVLENKSKP